MPASSADILARCVALAVSLAAFVTARCVAADAASIPRNVPTVALPTGEVTLHEQIDELIAASWAQRDLVGAGLSTDEEFLRRACLDLAGTIPTSDQARAFLNAKPLRLQVQGPYARFEDTNVGDELTVLFPLVEFRQSIEVGDVRREKFALHWVGSSLLKVEPAGSYMAMFTGAPRRVPPYSG